MSSQPLPPTHRLRGPGLPPGAGVSHPPAGAPTSRRPVGGSQAGSRGRGSGASPGSPVPALELGAWAPTLPGVRPGTLMLPPRPPLAAGGQAGLGQLTRRPSEAGRNRAPSSGTNAGPVGTVWAGTSPHSGPGLLPPERGSVAPRLQLRPHPPGPGPPPALRLLAPQAWLPGVGLQPRSCPSWLSAPLSCRSRRAEGTWVLTPGPAAWL